MNGDAYVVAIEGLEALRDLEQLPARILRAARQAVNKTTERTRAASAREIREQVNFPARYLSGQDGRLSIIKRASGDELTGIIRGRARPTSLARFMVGSGVGQRGVSVAVKPGGARFLPRAFAIRLRAGSANVDTKSNLGLAVRTENGERPRGAYKPKEIGPGLWLLYGPAINQVFRTVAEEQRPDAEDFLEREFLRLLDVDVA